MQWELQRNTGIKRPGGSPVYSRRTGRTYFDRINVFNKGGQIMKKFDVEIAVGFLFFGILCLGYISVKLGKINLIGDHCYP